MKKMLAILLLGTLLALVVLPSGYAGWERDITVTGSFRLGGNY